ncbi:MAG: CPBP family intramembrane glutamic endopeptidase, partial [Polyangiaceae bacterium]
AVLVIAALAAYLVRDNPLETASWLGLHGAPALALSLAEGALVAVVFVFCTRFWGENFAAGKLLTRDLSAKAAGLSTRQIVFVAASAAITEEIFFRGALAPTCGVFVSALLFGAMHFRSGLAWSALAAVFGAALGVVFLSSGSLAGPVFAHFAVDAIALLAARDASARLGARHNRAERLGGLLGAMHQPGKDRLC